MPNTNNIHIHNAADHVDDLDLIGAVDRLREVEDELIYLNRAIGNYEGRERYKMELERDRFECERDALSEKIEASANLREVPCTVAETFDVYSWDAEKRLGKRVVARNAREAISECVDEPDGTYRALRFRDFETFFVQFD